MRGRRNHFPAPFFSSGKELEHGPQAASPDYRHRKYRPPSGISLSSRPLEALLEEDDIRAWRDRAGTSRRPGRQGRGGGGDFGLMGNGTSPATGTETFWTFLKSISLASTPSALASLRMVTKRGSRSPLSSRQMAASEMPDSRARSAWLHTFLILRSFNVATPVFQHMTPSLSILEQSIDNTATIG